MLSINTNLSSLIAQNSMKTSTNKLNQAIERMTTGAKINHAKDNAANYSISTNMTTKMSAYKVAEDNVAMGMDMVATASDTLSEMQNHAERLRALATQARNGTYGGQSLNAIQSEADAITKEIERLYNTAQYNGVSLFNKPEYIIPDHLPKAGKSGFIDEAALGGESVIAKEEYNGFIKDPVTYTDVEINAMLASGEIVKLDNNVTSFTSGQKYLISNKSELKRLADLVNSNKNSSGAIFILGDDIDLEGEEWTPIGNGTYHFSGTFDGNGHKISNLKIDNPTADYQGLFGFINGGEVKNLGLEEGSVRGKSLVGLLAGKSSSNSKISNIYAIGNVIGQSESIGGLIGASGNSTISNTYTIGTVTGVNCFIGGLVGSIASTIVCNSYAVCDVIAEVHSAGGAYWKNSVRF